MACIAGTGCLWTDEGGESDITESRCGDRMIDELHETCDDGNTQSGDGCSSTCGIEIAVTVHWKIQNSAGEPRPCPVGFDTVEVTQLTLRFTGSPILFRCEDGQAHLEWREVPRSRTNGLRLRLTSSTSPAVASETVVSPYSGSVPLDDITGTLITDIGPLRL